MSMGLGRPILTLDELNAHVTQLATQDVIYAPLYDSNSWGTAGQTQLTFFTAPVGQGTTTAPGATGTKSLADTNLTSAGQLTKGNEFYMTGQEFMFFPGSLPEQDITAAGVNGFLNDTYNASKSGFVTLQVGSNRNYIQDGPLGIFPPNARLYVASAIGGTDTAGTQSVLTAIYAAWSGESYEITPVYIEATLGFQEYIQWPAAVTLATTARIFSRMRGYLVRNAQ
jgi:hypothetical protein